VSEIIDRLSPNIAPDKTTPPTRGKSNPALVATANAIGAIAPIVPIDVPIAVETIEDMIKSPGRINELGIIERPALTTASTPPLALATDEKAPARR